MFVFTEENIGTIKDAVYSKDGMKEKHAKKIEYAKTKGMLKDFNYSKYKVSSPPKNASMKVYEELKLLKDLPEDKDYVVEYDEIEKVFESVCKENNVEYPKDLVNELLDSSAGIILDLKWHYNRPRPNLLAKELGLDMTFFPLKTANTPSYPSGHATQGKLVSLLVADEVPLEHRKNVLEIGIRIGESRQIAGAHYPTDTSFGHKIGEELHRLSKTYTSLEPDLKLEDWDMLPDVKDLEKTVNRELKKLEEFELKEEDVFISINDTLPKSATARTEICLTP